MFRHTFRIVAYIFAIAFMMMLCGGGVAQEGQGQAHVTFEALIVDSNGDRVENPEREIAVRFGLNRRLSLTGKFDFTLATFGGRNAQTSVPFTFPLTNGQPSSNRLRVISTIISAGFDRNGLRCRTSGDTPQPSGGFFDAPDAVRGRIASFLLSDGGRYVCTAEYKARAVEEPKRVEVAAVTYEARIVDSSGRLVTNPEKEITVRFVLGGSAQGSRVSINLNTNGGRRVGTNTINFPLAENRLTISPVVDTPGFRYNGLKCETSDAGTLQPSGGFFDGSEAVPDRIASFLLADGGGYTCTADFTADVPLPPPTVTLVKNIVDANDNLITDPRRDANFNFDIVGPEGRVAERSLATESGTSKPSAPITLKAGQEFTILERNSLDHKPVSVKCEALDGSPGPADGFFTDPKDGEGARAIFTPTAGGIYRCTFGNRPIRPLPVAPKLTIIKNAVGGDGTFRFTVTSQAQDTPPASQPDPEIDTATRNKVEAIRLSPGEWTITEQQTPGFTLTDIACVNRNDPSFAASDEFVRNIGRRTAELFVSNNGDYVCTFTNEAEPPPLTAPTLTLVKEVVDANGNIVTGRDGTFKFNLFSDNTPRLPVPLLTTVDGTAQLPTPLALTAGESWTIVENPQPDYTLIGIDCVTLDGTPAPDVDFDADLSNSGQERATFTPAPGGRYQCTFRNRSDLAPPKLTLTKRTTGGDGTFSFSGSGSTEFTQQLATSDGASAPASITVAEGELVITETVADGFALAEITCTAGNPQVDIPNRKVSLTVAVGTDIACTFTNRRVVAELTLIKETIGGDGTFTFTGSGSANFRESIRTNDGRSTPVTLAVDEGDLVITEDPAKGFALERASCAGAKAEFDAKRRSVSLTIAGGARITCTFINREVAGRTTTIIRKFLKRRAEQLTNDTGAPRLIERQRFGHGAGLNDAIGATGSGSKAEGSLGFKASLGRLNADRTGEKAARLGVNPAEYGVTAGSRHRPGLDVWSEGSLSYFGVKDGNDDKTSSGRFGVLRLGADYLVSQKLLIGALLQFDHLHEESELDATGYVISGRGWMAGPYFEAEVIDGVYFDAKALFGRSTNDISPFNTYTDTFSTTRHLLAARLKGSWHWKESERAAWHFSPEAEVVWFQERSESYVDSNRVGIDGQRVSLGRVKVGPEVSYRHITNDGVRVEPHLGVKGLLSFGDAAGRDSLQSNGGVEEQAVDRFQVQFDGGVKVETPSGIRVDLRGSYTGLGKSDNHTIGGKLNVTVPLPSRQSLK